MIALIHKMSAVRDSEQKYNEITAENVIHADDKETNLGEKGRKAWQNLMLWLEKLSKVADVVQGYQCEDDVSLEGTPAFLLRGIQDATETGLKLPLADLKTKVLTRNAVDEWSKQQTASAMSSMDQNSDSPYSLGNFKEESLEVWQAAQYKVFLVLFKEVMKEMTWDADDKTIFAKMSQYAIVDDIRIIVGHAEHLLKPNGCPLEKLKDAIAYFGPDGPRDDIREMFSSGPPAALLAKAILSIDYVI